MKILKFSPFSIVGENLDCQFVMFGHLLQGQYRLLYLKAFISKFSIGDSHFDFQTTNRILLAFNLAKVSIYL